MPKDGFAKSRYSMDDPRHWAAVSMHGMHEKNSQDDLVFVRSHDLNELTKHFADLNKTWNRSIEFTIRERTAAQETDSIYG